jgi:hypothetical protein
MKLQAQLIYIVNTDTDVYTMKKHPFEFVFKTMAKHPIWLCIELHHPIANHSSFKLGEVHDVTFPSKHTVSPRERQISILRAHGFQKVNYTLISVNPKMKAFIQRKINHYKNDML